MSALLSLLITVILVALVCYIMRSDMLPSSTANDCPNHVCCDPKFLRYIYLPYSVSEFLADGKDLYFCQFGGVDILAFVKRRDRVIASALLGHILHIVFGRAKKQMLRIYASPHVALMAHMQAIWNRPVVDFITKAMGREDFISEIDLAVPVGAFAALPKPTSISLNDVGPKTIFERRVLVSEVVKDIPHRLTFNDAFASIVARRYWRRLAASTFAEFWGIMGLHKILRNLVPSQGRSNVAWYFYW